jgi:hypothetical protein
LAFADLVLRRLAAELGEVDEVEIEVVRVVELSARIGLTAPVRAARGSAFDVVDDTTLELPRTRRALGALRESASHALPALVPFVSALSADSATVAPAPESGRLLGAGAACRAADLHWLAPWRGEVLTVAAQSSLACQVALGPLGCVERSGSTHLSGRSWLVLAGESESVDLDVFRTDGGHVGVLRFPDDSVFDPDPLGAQPPGWPEDVSCRQQYVLVDHLSEAACA